MRVLSWNIRHGGGSRAGAILDSIASFTPDICILPEFRNNQNKLLFINSLKELGLKHYLVPNVDEKINTVGIFSSFQIDLCQFRVDLNLSRYLVTGIIEGINFIGVYFPQKNFKKPVFETIIQKSGDLLNQKSLLVGDFNTGLPFIDEQSSSFYCVDDFKKLYEIGWINQRDRFNQGHKEYTWYSNAGNGFRIDHLLASPILSTQITNVYYDHSVRENKISDHSALIFEIN